MTMAFKDNITATEMAEYQRTLGPEAIARELRRLIFSQPPEVIQHLADGVSFDDEYANVQSDIHDAIDEMFCDNGFPSNGILKRQKVYCGLSLPTLRVDITVSGEDGEQTFDWEFSK